MIFLALLSHTLGIAFIQLVERPHMQKLYGRGLRQDAGLVRSIKRSLPPSFKQLHGSVDRILDESIEFIEEVLDTARPKLAAGVTTFVKDTSELFHKYPARITITRIEPDVAGYDMNDYSLSVDTADCITIKDGAEDKSEVPVFEYGSPIKISWTAPLNHSKKDWVGLYMIGQNPSREVTNVSSWGRWVATNEGSFDSVLSEKGLITSDAVVSKPDSPNASANNSKKSGKSRKKSSTHEVASGQMVFSGDKLWWTQGVFEFRYHHNGKHNVMATSRPFEIRIPKFDDEHIPSHLPPNRGGFMTAAVEQALLPIVQSCFDRDPEISPQTAEEPFGCETESDLKYAKRVVYAVHQMFGIEFATEVVRADGNVQNLAWRVCNAMKVLAPYSMRKSNGASTPTPEAEP
ncbi:phosphatidylethanolamine N-methyltransferase [Microsporum audouinii]